MANNNAISISFVLKDGTNGLKTLAVGATDLKKILSSTVVEAERLKKPFINFASLATGIDAVSAPLSNVKNTLKGLTDAYAAQVTVETQLATNMRNTMAACDEDIQSIKALCSAQQALGVIGDEVQLAGAQELATYLAEKESLEALIPVMNDMLAQQYGLNASQENAQNIATMLGKVMDGQTGALSRYGYSFDETQEKILKFGTEAQRAAVLCDVVGSSVGGMNAELAKTDAGQLKQLNNTLGDLKEKAGELAQKVMPFVSMAADAAIALAALTKLSQGTKILIGFCGVCVTRIKAFNKATLALSSSTSGAVKAVGTARLFLSQFCTAVQQGARGLKLFVTAWRGMLISTGIGIAIAAVTTVIGYLATRSDEATESTNKLIDAQERAKRSAERLEELHGSENSTMENHRALLSINISKLKEFQGTKEQEAKLVAEMNDAYGETMGYFSRVADWYDALIANSEAYCRQMVIEARIRTLAAQIAQKEQENYDISYNKDGSVRKYSTVRKTRIKRDQLGPNSYAPTGTRKIEKEEIAGTSDYDRAKQALADNKAEIAGLSKQLNDSVKEAAQINFTIRGSAHRPNVNPAGNTSDMPEWNNDAANLLEIGDNLKILNGQLQTASVEEAALINQQIAKWQEKADAIRNAGKAVENNGPVFDENATTLKGIGDNISALNGQLQTASVEEAALINQQIDKWQEKADAIRNAGKAVENNGPVFDENATTLKGIGDNISALNGQLQTASVEEAALINQQIAKWQDKADAIRNAGKEAEITFDTFRSGYDSLKGIGSGVESVTNALEGNGNAWQTVTGIVDGFLQIYEGIKTVVGIINMLSVATMGKKRATDEETQSLVANTAASLTNTAAKSGESIAEATASGAKMPFPLNLVAIAAGVAAVVSALAIVGSFATGGIVGGNSPSGDKLLARVNSGEMILNREQQQRLFKALSGTAPMPFANGGIIKGPTLGFLGEYAGASNNPEVVAPLDRLRSLIRPADDSGGVVTFKIEGRTLVGIIEKENNVRKRR